MSVWIKAKEQLPPLDEEVLILYKYKTDDLDYSNLFYGLSKRVIDNNFKFEKWSSFTEYQSYCEVVFWARLYDMPLLEQEEVNEEGN